MLFAVHVVIVAPIMDVVKCLCVAFLQQLECQTCGFLATIQNQTTHPLACFALVRWAETIDPFHHDT